MHPEPVPTSTIRRDWRARPALSAVEGAPAPQGQDFLNYMLGFRARDQYCWRNDKIHSPKFLVSGDVLRRNSPGALSQGIFVTAAFFSRQLSFGMGVEIGAVTAESEHEQKLGVQSSRANLSAGEALDGGGKRVSK